MTANELRKRFIDFFVKNYDHKEIKGASLIPENDPTVLFTTAGMHPLVPFLTGAKHPSGKRLVDVQKCVRTDDIDEVGDECHLTFFEMLGNWSLGDYFKELAIKMSFEFMTKSLKEGGLGLDIGNLAVSCFAGDNDAPKDEESAKIWRGLGIKMERIAFLPKKNNWWGPAGKTGPCGPDTEMFYWTADQTPPKEFDPKNPKWVEIWNDVFMEYNKKEDGTYEPLNQKNVDTGMGLERVLAIMNGVSSPFETELFEEIIEKIRSLADKNQIVFERIIADHIRAATFIIGDEYGVGPSKNDQGYIVRRLLRRSVRYGQKLGIAGEFLRKLAEIVVQNYSDFYPVLSVNKKRILEEISQEERKFSATLDKGLSILHKEFDKHKNIDGLDSDFCFHMFDTYGFPIEMIIEELKSYGWIKNDRDKAKILLQFDKCFKVHQETSRAGAEKKFAGGLADTGEQSTKYHTATHLLHRALRMVLGEHVEQKGSNITAERLRFDFSHKDKMTEEEKKKVENIVNEQIKKALPVSMEEMSVDEAKKEGAIGLFESKYGERVKVYTIGDDKNFFSREICMGPHVKNTSELGHFKIAKEESSSSGVRRIKAVLG